MKLLFAFLIVFSLYACDKHNIDTTMPLCIEDIINEPLMYEELKAIQVIELNDELHYWLNTNAIHYDGLEYIVNNRCDTLCYFCGECLPPNCLDNYNEKEWQIIWEQ